MKQLKINSLILALIIPGGLFAQGERQTTSFSLEDCIEYALKNNEEISNMDLAREIAKAQVGETTADGLPQINLNADLTNNYSIRKSIVDASNFDPTAPEGTEVELEFGLQYEGNAGLNLRQMIFDGSYFVGLRAARTFKELSEKDHIKSKIDVVDAVTKAYYVTLVSQDRYDLLKVTLRRYDTLLDETSVLFENGFAEKIEVNRVKVLVNNTRIAVKNSEEVLRNSYDLLKFQMGYPVRQPIALADKISDIIFEYQQQDIVDFDYSDRIEYSQLLTNRQLIELQRKNNQVQYLPTIDLFANFGYNTGTNLSDQLLDFNDRWLNNGNVGLALNVPVFDGLRKKYRIQQDKLQIQQIDNQISLLKNNIDLEILQAENSLRVNMQNLEAQKENMELSEEVYDVARIKYTEGVGANTEVLDATTDFREAENSYYEALYNALIGKVELERALGKLLK